MKNLRHSKLLILALILLSSAWATVADAQIKKRKTTKGKKNVAAKPVVKKPAAPPPVAAKPAYPDFKILLEGQHSKVETPFVFVARDAETYALMRSMVEGLPASSGVDFSKTAVVAAFAGERNTGGWMVSIRHLPGGKILIDLNSPRKDQMTTQVISTPFQIVLVPALQMEPLPPVEMTPTWSNKIKGYRVSKGEFEFSGGIRGMVKKFGVEGTIDALTYADKITYFFNLSGKGADNQLKMSEVASGALNGGQIEIARLEPGTLVEIPHPCVKATGTATEQKLTLNFESLPPTIADGFMGRGRLEAVKR